MTGIISSNPILLTLLAISAVLIASSFIVGGIKKKAGQQNHVEFVVFIVGFCFMLVFFFGFMQNLNYRDDASEYVTDYRSYRKSDRQLKKDQHADRIDKAHIQHARQAFHKMPSLQFHNPKISNMSLTQFNKFLSARERTKKRIRADKRQLHYDKGDVPPDKSENNNNLSNVRYDLQRLHHQRHKFFVRHSSRIDDLLRQDKNKSTFTLRTEAPN